MCKKYEQAMDSLHEKLRGETVTERRAIYTETDGERDYLGFFAVIDGVLANFFEVDHNGKVRVCGLVPFYGGMSHSRVAYEFGTPGAKVAFC